MTKYLYCFVRKDISLEYQIIQIGHAAYDAGRMLGDQKQQSPSIVLFEVANLLELLEASEYLDKHKIRYEMFYEPDYDTKFTALVTEPIENQEKRSLFANFTLYRA